MLLFNWCNIQRKMTSRLYGVIWYQSHFEFMSICWAYRATCYRTAIGPPIIYSLTHELAVSAWRGCVGDPTSPRDYSLSLYISGCKPQSYEPVLLGWVRLKVHFVIDFVRGSFYCVCNKKIFILYGYVVPSAWKVWHGTTISLLSQFGHQGICGVFHQYLPMRYIFLLLMVMHFGIFLNKFNGFLHTHLYILTMSCVLII